MIVTCDGPLQTFAIAFPFRRTKKSFRWVPAHAVIERLSIHIVKPYPKGTRIMVGSDEVPSFLAAIEDVNLVVEWQRTDGYLHWPKAGPIKVTVLCRWGGAGTISVSYSG